MKINTVCFITIIITSLVSCGGGGDDGTKPLQPPLGDQGQVISSSTYTADTQSWQYDRLRLPNQSGGYSYAEFFKANSTKPRPTIVITRPYLGIDWSAEQLDLRWSAEYTRHLANGGSAFMCKPDIDGPNYKAGESANICYLALSSDNNAVNGLIYLINQFNVLFVYGRFYAGGDIKNDINDMIAGLRFLATQSNVDKSKIAITGKSWGGFEALYAALYAPENVKPAVVVAVYPVTDFSNWINFINVDLPPLVSPTVLAQYNKFYDPFLRRMYAHLGQAPTTDYSGYTINDLSALLTMPLLIAHDDADTILPAQYSHKLAALNPNRVDGFWYTRQAETKPVPWQTAITTHGQIDSNVLIAAYETFTSLFMMQRLANIDDTIILVYGQQDMLSFFTNIKSYQSTGLDVTWLVPRLIELCDNRVSMFDLTPIPNNQELKSGALFVAQWLNQVWNTNLNAANVEQYLKTNGLPTL